MSEDYFQLILHNPLSVTPYNRKLKYKYTDSQVETNVRRHRNRSSDFKGDHTNNNRGDNKNPKGSLSNLSKTPNIYKIGIIEH